jgi:hypothetical protein
MANLPYVHCLVNTIQTLNRLAECGYKVSSKEKICKEQIVYLRFQLQQCQWGQVAEWKNAIACILYPWIHRHLQGFLEMADYCRKWISNFGLLVMPLYEALIVTELEPLLWLTGGETTYKTYKTWENQLMSAPSWDCLTLKNISTVSAWATRNWTGNSY